MKLLGISFGKKLRTNGLIRIHMWGRGKISIGNNVRINSGGMTNPIGYDVRTQFQVLENGNLSIGNNVGISNTAITCANKVTIEDNVYIGAGVKIYDTDFHPIDYMDRVLKKDSNKTMSRPIIISEGVFIGSGSLILKGVKIGQHSVVGAGSVVTKSIPSNEVWAGNPAHYIRNINNET